MCKVGRDLAASSTSVTTRSCRRHGLSECVLCSLFATSSSNATSTSTQEVESTAAFSKSHSSMVRMLTYIHTYIHTYVRYLCVSAFVPLQANEVSSPHKPEKLKGSMKTTTSSKFSSAAENILAEDSSHTYMISDGISFTMLY